MPPAEAATPAETPISDSSATGADDAILSAVAWLGLLGILVVGAMMQPLGTLLSGMHTEGNPAAGLEALGDPTTASAAILDWFSYAARANRLLGMEIDGARAASVTSPRHLVALHAWLDSYFFVTFYLMLVIGLLLLARLRIKRDHTDRDPGEWGRRWEERNPGNAWRAVVNDLDFFPQFVFALGIVTVIIGALVDALIENPLEVRVMDGAAHVLRDDPAAGSEALGFEIGHLLAWLDRVTFVKVAAIGTAILCTLLLWIIRSTDHRRRTREVWRSIVAVRAQIVVVVILAWVITRQEAALDAIRGWGAGQTAWTIGLGLLLAAVTWEGSRWLMVMRQWSDRRSAKSLPVGLQAVDEHEARPAALKKVVVAIGLGSLWPLLGWQGAAIPAAFLGLSALGDFMKPPAGRPGGIQQAVEPTARPATAEQEATHASGEPWHGLALVIAAGVTIAVGLGMIGAAFGQLVYQPGIDASRLRAIVGGGVAVATSPAVIALVVGIRRRPPRRPWRELVSVLVMIAAAISGIAGLVMITASLGRLVVEEEIDALRLWSLAGIGVVLVVLATFARRRAARSRSAEGSESDAPVRADPERVDDMWQWLGTHVIRFDWIIAAMLVVLLALPLWNTISGHAWWELPESMGPLAVVLSFGIAAMIFVILLSLLAELVKPGRILRALGARRMPFYALGLAWLLVLPVVDGPGFHDVRLLEPEAPPIVQSVGLNETFREWLKENVPDTPSASATRFVSPMLLVASSGGGIRAAYWSALALSCINESEPLAFAATSTSLPPDHSVCASARVVAELRSEARTGTAESAEAELEAIRGRAEARARTIFAMSGISGGSLGVAAYAAHLVEALEDRSQLDDATWLDRRLNGDYLSATMAWALFVETPRAFLRFDPGTDRAEAMERAWERSWVVPGEPTDGVGLDVGLRKLWLEHGTELPVLLLNSTSVADGCRFNGSVVNAGIERAADRCHSLRSFARIGQDRTEESQALASTLDLSDFLCLDEDIRLSTAVLMSARFPGISPTGRLEACEADGTGRTLDEPNESDAPRAVTYLVDGGYLDTSGASALTDVAQALAPSIEDVNEEDSGSCVVPFYVQLDNGHQQVASPPSDPEPSELRAPLTTTNATRGARAASAEAVTALDFSRWFSTAGKRLMAGGWPLTDRYAWIVPEAHPGVQAPLGWTMSPSAIEDLRTQIRQPLNALALQEIRRWLAGGMTCSPVMPGERYISRAFPTEVELGLDAVGGRWIVTDTPQMLSGFTDLGEGMRGSITVIPRIENLSEWMLEMCRRIQADPTSGLGSCAGATDVTRPSFVMAPLGYVRALLNVPGDGSIEFGAPATGAALIVARNVDDVTLVAAVSDVAGRPLGSAVRQLISIVQLAR